MIKAQTLKGFRDFLPKEAKKREYVINTLKQVFESYGFEPLETPALEYEEILLDKYGDEGDKLMYRFTDNGGRKVALRYDQTVPLARVVAQYASTGSAQALPMPFKRYQIQNVWRAENPQKGRYREFLQCDADIVGTDSPLSDAEVIMVAAKSIEKLGFKNFKVLINDRTVFKNLPKETIIAIDKLKKNGKEKVLEEIIKKGIPKEQAILILSNLENAKPTEKLNQILLYLEKSGVEKFKYKFSPTLARGLDYYTGMIFEIEIEGYTAGSVCGGGRYDNLIGIFSGKPIPATGFAFGFDRLMEAMNELNLFPSDIDQSLVQVLVTIFNSDFLEKSLEIVSKLRNNGVNAEIFLNENASLDKQLKYTDQKGIPYAIILGPNEAEKNEVTIRNMKTREQKTVSLENLHSFLF